MPHTSHKKKKGAQNKRQEVLDENGWTQITTTARISGNAAKVTQNGTDKITEPPPHHDLLTLVKPMPPAQGTTLESMHAQFGKVEARWKDTELCKTLERVLTSKILPEVAERNITAGIVFGTGSFCGDAVHWIDRHQSAYFQLAAFKSVLDAVEKVQGEAVAAYAQEPHYNELDTTFLASLNITKVDHPRGFELLDVASFAYSPAAEPEVEAQIIDRDPQVWLHRSLTGTSSTLFAESYEHAQLPPALDLKNFPFHGSVIWWKRPGRTPAHDGLCLGKRST
jgi:hypothetical protein